MANTFYIGSRVVGSYHMYGKEYKVWGTVTAVSGDTIHCRIGMTPGSVMLSANVRSVDFALDPDMSETNSDAEARGMR